MLSGTIIIFSTYKYYYFLENILMKSLTFLIVSYNLYSYRYVSSLIKINSC